MATIQTQGFTLDDSGKRIVVDPITRIEGHLRIEVNVDKDNVIRNAVSTGTMWRGLEVILKGRDPRDAWAFVERICGVCTGVHALASVRAVEDAIGIRIPKNANIIRNLMHATLYAQDHLVHFYHLHALDWVDVVSALKADPKRVSELQQSISPWPNSSPGYFREVQNRLKRFVEGGQLGIFANGYWGHPAMHLPPEVNLLAVHHYLQALEYQRKANQVVAILGSKTPNIQNLAVGGVANAIKRLWENIGTYLSSLIGWLAGTKPDGTTTKTGEPIWKFNCNPDSPASPPILDDKRLATFDLPR